MTEREITTGPVDVAGPGGRLRREAVGWSRHPVDRWNVRGRWGRQKRWEYWCIADGERLLAVTVADLDAFGAGGVTFLDCVTRELVEKLAARPLGLARPLPDMPHGGDARFDGMGLSVELRVEPCATRIVVGSRRIRADVVVDRPPAHQTLNVPVPRILVLFLLCVFTIVGTRHWSVDAYPARGHVHDEIDHAYPPSKAI
jgi:hypothetical protein